MITVVITLLRNTAVILSVLPHGIILENIRGGLLKQIVTELPISPEMSLAICLYILTRGDYKRGGEMAGIAQSTVYCIVIEVSELLLQKFCGRSMLKNFSQTLWKNSKLLWLIHSRNGSSLLHFQQLRALTCPLNAQKEEVEL